MPASACAATSSARTGGAATIRRRSRQSKSRKRSRRSSSRSLAAVRAGSIRRMSPISCSGQRASTSRTFRTRRSRRFSISPIPRAIKYREGAIGSLNRGQNVRLRDRPDRDRPTGAERLPVTNDHPAQWRGAAVQLRHRHAGARNGAAHLTATSRNRAGSGLAGTATRPATRSPARGPEHRYQHEQDVLDDAADAHARNRARDHGHSPYGGVTRPNASDTIPIMAKWHGIHADAWPAAAGWNPLEERRWRDSSRKQLIDEEDAGHEKADVEEPEARSLARRLELPRGSCSRRAASRTAKPCRRKTGQRPRACPCRERRHRDPSCRSRDTRARRTPGSRESDGRSTWSR